MQKKELDKLNFTKLWMDGFPGIDPFHYPVWDTLPEEEEDSCRNYGGQELVLKEFPVRQSVAPKQNNMIFEHRPIERNLYPLGASVWGRKDAYPFEMPFSTPPDLQQLLGLIHALNVVLPWDCIKKKETFQTEDVALEDLEYSLSFFEWEKTNYTP